MLHKNFYYCPDEASFEKLKKHCKYRKSIELNFSYWSKKTGNERVVAANKSLDFHCSKYKIEEYELRAVK